MHSLEILELGERLWFPEKLGECDKRQYPDACKLIFMYQTDELTYAEFRVQLLCSLLNLDITKSELEHEEESKWDNIYYTSEKLDSFFSFDENGQKHLILDFIHNPMQVVQYKAHTFKGPKDAFQGITYGQLEDGIGEIGNFMKYGEIQSLVKLFAIFYLQKNEKYSVVNLDKRIAFFDLLDIRYVYGFYLLFVSFFNYLTKECVLVIDGKELDLRILFASPENSEGNTTPDPNDPEGLGMRATSFQLAESGVFGTLDELRNSDAMMVLIRMYDLIIRARKEEKERKDQEEEEKSKRNNHD